jgi:hypothetical protein
MFLSSIFLLLIFLVLIFRLPHLALAEQWK